MTTPARVHSFDRDGYTLWAFRTQAMHGLASFFTLWTPRAGGGQDMAIGAVTAQQIRRFLRDANRKGSTNDQQQ